MTNKKVDLTSGIHTSEECTILTVSWTFPKDDVLPKAVSCETLSTYLSVQPTLLLPSSFALVYNKCHNSHGRKRSLYSKHNLFLGMRKNDKLGHSRRERNGKRWIWKQRERGAPDRFGLTVGQEVPGGSMTVVDVLFVYLPPPYQRGGNAALIYHSSAPTIWSRSDDPHLAPNASSYSPSP